MWRRTEAGSCRRAASNNHCYPSTCATTIRLGGTCLFFRNLIRRRQATLTNDLQCESKKSPCGFLAFFPNGWEFFDQILRAYCAFLSTLDYQFLLPCEAMRSAVLPWHVVRPSVCPSVTLRYRDHIRSNSAKIISRLISLTISLSADPNMTDLLQREHPQILAGIGVG